MQVRAHAGPGTWADAAGCTGLGAVLACTATGLTNGNGYDFQVRATNARGTGPFSDPGGPFTPTTPASSFLTTWTTANTTSGSSAVDQVGLPLDPTGTCVFTVAWGDGASNRVTSCADAGKLHTYPAPGTYTVTISFPNAGDQLVGWRFANQGDRNRLVDISQWGAMRLGNNNAYFRGCENLVISAPGGPDLTGTTDLSYAFYRATGFNSPLAGWDTSHVTNMGWMFYDVSAFNQPIGSWDTSHVTDMGRMFLGVSGFNQPIGNWDTSHVTDMSGTFYGASAFNQDIGAWNTSNVKQMVSMFSNASAFNQPIGSWDVSNVSNMDMMFTGALSTANYNALLTGWASRPVKPGVTFGAGSSKYSAPAVGARGVLTGTPNNWTINDGGIAP